MHSQQIPTQNASVYYTQIVFFQKLVAVIFNTRVYKVLSKETYKSDRSIIPVTMIDEDNVV